MPTLTRSRLLYAGIIALIVAVGLPTRLIPEFLPDFMVNYLGDALWALVIFLLIGLLLPKRQRRTIFLLALAVTWGIEFSQFYQADWINAIRAYKLGGLILGYTFLPSDLLMYLCGVGAGAALEWRFLRKHEAGIGAKSLWKRDWFRLLAITSFIFVTCGLVTVPVTYVVFQGIASGNFCPASLPFTVESWGRFRLPWSADNLESFCFGMQGWIAVAEFDMSPSDIDSFIDNTFVEKPLVTAISPDDPRLNDPVLPTMKSYLFGEAKNGWQIVLIDTSDPALYHVYFKALGGN